MFSLCLSTIMFSITDPSCLGNQVEVRLMDRAQQESPQHGTKSLQKSIPINPNESSYRGHLGSLVEFVQNHLAKALSSTKFILRQGITQAQGQWSQPSIHIMGLSVCLWKYISKEFQTVILPALGMAIPNQVPEQVRVLAAPSCPHCL